MKVWLSLALLSLSSCTSFDYRYSDEEGRDLLARALGHPEVPTEIDPLWLSAEARAELDVHIKRRSSDLFKLNTLREFLFGEEGLNVQYSANFTKTAMEVWQTRSGNCLSMSNLFVASARYVGLEATFKTVEVRPTWDTEGSTMIRYEHIVTEGRLRGGREYVIDFLPDFVIGDKESVEVSDKNAMALYYNNLGAESVIDGKYDRAIDNIRVSLALKPDSSDAWNNMGAAMRRVGDSELAEFSYQRALLLDSNNYSALSNLAQFYRLEGREKEAERFAKRVQWYRSRNPYFHYFIARFFYERGEFRDAVRLLERSIELKKDEPVFYEALAKTYDALGDQHHQRSNLVLAQKYREQTFTPVPRERNHRIWIQNIGIN